MSTNAPVAAHHTSRMPPGLHRTPRIANAAMTQMAMTSNIQAGMLNLAFCRGAIWILFQTDEIGEQAIRAGYTLVQLPIQRVSHVHVTTLAVVGNQQST